MFAGEGYYELAGKRYTCSAGDTFVIFPGALITYIADPINPWQYAWAGIGGHAALSVLAALGITQEQPIVHSPRYRKLKVLYARLRQSLMTYTHPALANLESSGILRLLLHELGQANAQHIAQGSAPLSDIERQVDQAIRWMSLQFYQAISVEHMAKSLGYHRTHLSKMFKRKTGKSPMQYLLAIRMEKAQELLLSTSLTIDEIASSVGYQDSLYFSKQFRQWCGLSPTGYRKFKLEELQHG